jgi:uncharacterized membrane protein YphA (DoxX/SURF4 family)
MKPKTIKILMWSFITLMAVQFLAAGVGKITGDWNNMFIRWGYSTSFAYIIGFIEVAAVVGLFVPKTRKWAVLVLIITMIGAVYTHIMNTEYSRIIHNMILFVILSGIYYLDRKRIEILVS